MKNVILLFASLLVLAAGPIGAATPLSFDLPSTEDPYSRISVYSFPDFSIVEIDRGSSSEAKGSTYEVHVAPPLSESTRSQLSCLDPYSDAYSTRSCDPGLPDLEPDFSTCSEGTIGPGEAGPCVQVWDMGSFMIVATYSPLGILNDIEIVEEDEEEGEDEGQ